MEEVQPRYYDVCSFPLERDVEVFSGLMSPNER